MRIRVLSDLHLEFEPDAPSEAAGRLLDGALPQSEADVVVLAGDIGVGAEGVRWAKQTFRSPVLYVAGNHEFYGDRIDLVLEAMREEAAGSTVHVLENEAAVMEAAGQRVRFIGCTLWTDFRLYPESIDHAMWAAERGMNDYHRIAVLGPDGTPQRLRPQTTRDLHRRSRDWLEDMLHTPFDGHTVVVTHMLPSPSSVAQRYHGSPLNAAFASDLDALIGRYAPSLWIHGHTHDSCDYRLGDTRVVCNPRGYYPDELNPSFDPIGVYTVGPSLG